MTDDELIAGLATELWRLRQAALQAAVAIEEPVRRERQISRLKFCDGRIAALLDGAAFHIPDFEGQVYHTGMPVRPVNLSDDDEGAELVVVRTLEPTIIRNGRALATGKVVVERNHQGDA